MPLFKLPGIHVPHHKNTDEMKAVRMPIPKEVILQMNMHIGAFAKPIVNVGDQKDSVTRIILWQIQRVIRFI